MPSEVVLFSTGHRPQRHRARAHILALPLRATTPGTSHRSSKLRILTLNSFQKLLFCLLPWRLWLIRTYTHSAWLLSLEGADPNM